MDDAYYRKWNDRSLNSSTYHKKDGTNIRAKLKEESRQIIQEEEVMRDPERIEPMLERIKILWKCHPDMRLCQLLENAIAIGGRGTKNIYYLEDDDLDQAIKNILKNGF